MIKSYREQRDEAIRRIRSLIRLAESTTFAPEAKQARLKAGYLMARFKLNYEEDIVEQAPPPPVRRPAPAPVRRPTPPPVPTPAPDWGPFAHQYVSIYTQTSNNGMGGFTIFTIRVGS